MLIQRNSLKYCSNNFTYTHYVFKLLLKKNSDKKPFIVSFIYTIQVKELIVAGKLLYQCFFEKYLMSAPFELAPPHELPKLNEHPGCSFDQYDMSLTWTKSKT